MENKNIKWCVAWFADQPGAITGANRQGLAKNSKWTKGDTITVSFLDGDESLKEKVKNYALEWTLPGMANLNLGFVKNSTNTMIRVSFEFSGNWSLIGRECLKKTDSSFPTMNMELTPNSPEEVIRREALHEFGHALGLIHEHQIPGNGIDWNRERVKIDLSGPPNEWSPQQIEDNVLKPASTDETNYTVFDPKSIMVYPVPPEWTNNGFSVDWNNILSERDKSFIRQQYS